MRNSGPPQGCGPLLRSGSGAQGKLVETNFQPFCGMAQVKKLIKGDRKNSKRAGMVVLLFGELTWK
jgi:hypothetical protein